MKEFIDTTPSKSGTPLNRANLMAAQGFGASTTTFLADGSVRQVFDNGETLTVTFNADGSITQTFSGEKTIAKKTVFNTNNTISEVMI